MIHLSKEKDIISSLKTLSDQCSKNTENMVHKINIMQDIYLARNHDLYGEEEIKLIRYYMQTTLYKFHLAGMSLEQLWLLSMLKRNELWVAIDNSINKLDISDQELNMISFVFENFLFQSKSFLDFMMIFINLVLKTNHKGFISQKKFYKYLKSQNDNHFSEKAKNVINYFNTYVFGNGKSNGLSPNNWGTILTELRDKVTHRDKIRPAFNSSELLHDKILFNWPTIKDLTYDRFYQYIQNGMFGLLSEVFPIIFNLKWISGQVDYNSWD